MHVVKNVSASHNGVSPPPCPPPPAPWVEPSVMSVIVLDTGVLYITLHQMSIVYFMYMNNYYVSFPIHPSSPSPHISYTSVHTASRITTNRALSRAIIFISYTQYLLYCVRSRLRHAITPCTSRRRLPRHDARSPPRPRPVRPRRYPAHPQPSSAKLPSAASP